MSLIRRYGLILASTFVLAQPAWALWGDTTELTRQMQALQQRVDALEARLGKLQETVQQNQPLLDLLKEVESLKADVAKLRGQAEVQGHQLETLGKRQGDLYVDLDKRVEDLARQLKSLTQAAAMATAPTVASAAAAASGTTTPAQSQTAPATATEDPLAESSAYEAALNDFKAGNYTKSVAAFAAFLKSYPDSTLAANALYWSGYAYYASKDYKNAIAQQMKLVSEHAQSSKVPDALLNIASNQIELNDLASAKKNLEELIARYPGTNAAAIAAKRLNLLK